MFYNYCSPLQNNFFLAAFPYVYQRYNLLHPPPPLQPLNYFALGLLNHQSYFSYCKLKEPILDSGTMKTFEVNLKWSVIVWMKIY